MAHHAAKIEVSKDLIIVVNLLKNADHPLSAEEITVTAYDYEKSGKMLLNAAEKIGQIRAPINSDRGYHVSYSTRWRVAQMGEPVGKRNNKDGSVTFIIEKATKPWHDGRPRYYAISLPGWSPRWIINEEGEQVWLRSGQPAVKPESQAPKENSEPETEEQRCVYCGGQIPIERLKQLSKTCSDEHFELWRKSIRPVFATKTNGQGGLL